MDSALRQISDRFEILDTLARYVRGVDRRQWDLVRSTYHSDAYDDHGGYRGPVDGFIEWVSDRHSRYEASTHFLGSSLIEFEGEDRARVETYFVAYQRLGEEAADTRRFMLGDDAGGDLEVVDVEVIGRYLDLFERRDGTWRIAHRRTAFDAIKAQPGGKSSWLQPDWQLGRRNDTDPVFVASDALRR